MKTTTIELFMPLSADGLASCGVDALLASGIIEKATLWCGDASDVAIADERVIPVAVKSLSASRLFMDMASSATADYVLYVAKEGCSLPGVDVLERMLDAMAADNSVMLYSDCYKSIDGVCEEAAVIDYQCGSLRNDFDFGSVILMRTSALKSYLQQEDTEYEYAGFYQLRLALSRVGCFTHFKEFAYTECEDDRRKSGEKQFDYVNPAQREVQIEMEKVCTEHLKQIGGYLPPFKYDDIDLSFGEFPVEASVVIPVLNRKTTIADAITSVLKQKCSFKFNILVVDNHSTDGTGEIIDSFGDERVVHIIPESTKLGIGGCWNYAVNSPLCGRFAVQLDSDDIYSGDDTLQRIVDEFYRQQCAMLIGTYRICNFELETLPPGIIDHKEWTEENGRNNALRINGLGAPRAFYTPVIREVGFPNVSYGEDYAVGLQISRRYRIGRIYDVLYLCRRWGGNSDAALSRAKVNANNYYKDSIRSEELKARLAYVKQLSGPCRRGVSNFFDKQLKQWSDVAARYKAIESVQVKRFDNGLALQFNPDRIRSTAAAVDKKSIAQRPCFLCAANRPAEQIVREVRGSMELLVNPFPIMGEHYTIVTKKHQPQLIAPIFADMLALARRWRGMTLFYNGATCGASAPDHAHLQAVRTKEVPMLDAKWTKRLSADSEPVCGTDGAALYLSKGYVAPLFVIKAADSLAMEALFARLMAALPVNEGAAEPAVNVMTFHKDGDGWTTIVFPRSKHRPDCYFAEGDARRVISPGALDMAGILIAARREDYENITATEAASILREVSLSEALCASVAAELKG
ncbi:MAG: DUF4922 domain-containing protein [Bacteroidaceae bacterium]|nr:DUF4922 domain-containing protein [Bacteroidaceae bacterium]